MATEVKIPQVSNQFEPIPMPDRASCQRAEMLDSDDFLRLVQFVLGLRRFVLLRQRFAVQLLRGLRSSDQGVASMPKGWIAWVRENADMQTRGQLLRARAGKPRAAAIAHI